MANKHMKRCSTLLVIKEMRVKIIVRYHYTLIRMAKVKKTDHSQSWCLPYSAGGNVKWYKPFRKLFGSFLKG